MTIRFAKQQLKIMETALRNDCDVIMSRNADFTINYSNAAYVIESITHFPDKDWQLNDWIKIVIEHDFYIQESREETNNLTNEEKIEQGKYFEFHQTQNAHRELFDPTMQSMDAE